MPPIALVRFYQPQLGSRVGVEIAGRVHDVTGAIPSVSAWLQQSAGRVQAAIDELAAAAAAAPDSIETGELERPPAPDRPHWLPPVDRQDVWAAGVTYERSRAARQEEPQDGGDVYARVYTAARPELFFKAQAAWVAGAHDAVGIRCDATWNVPEPELALVANPAMQIVGYTIGNDMSSRDIEGENPLYLPQAKIYRGSCALGPALVIGPLLPRETGIRLAVDRAGDTVFAGATALSQIRRSFDELADWLFRENEFPHGAWLMTGTGIVPPTEFTLASGDVIRIGIDGLGELTNPVE